MAILSDKEWHNALALAYDKIFDNRKHATIITLAAIHGEPTSVYATHS